MRKISVFALAVLFAACHSTRSESANSDGVLCEEIIPDTEYEVAASVRNAKTMGAALTDNAVEQSVTPRKIIKNGNIGISVDNIEQARVEVYELINKYEGYCAEENYNIYDNIYRRGNSYKAMQYDLQVRIPCDNFDAFIADIESCDGILESKMISISDVTTEFIDLEARLANKRKYLARYTEMLKSAKTINDITAIEEKIRVLEEQIESVTGRLKYLNHQVEYSRLHLAIEQKYYGSEPDNNKKVWKRLWNSFVSGARGLVEFLFILVKLWPLVLAAVAIFFVIRRRRKKRKE